MQRLPSLWPLYATQLSLGKADWLTRVPHAKERIRSSNKKWDRVLHTLNGQMLWQIIDFHCICSLVKEILFTCDDSQVMVAAYGRSEMNTVG
jgi:hypothetical protein